MAHFETTDIFKGAFLLSNGGILSGITFNDRQIATFLYPLCCLCPCLGSSGYSTINFSITLRFFGENPMSLANLIGWIQNFTDKLSRSFVSNHVQAFC